MSRVAAMLKKILKIVMWMTISFFVLLIVVAALIQIPAVQLRVVHWATTYVSDKTHTRVDIRKIHITFPTTVVIEGLYLEDLHKDTLIYAARTELNIAFKDLFVQKLYFRSLALEGVVLNINRDEHDSFFNYNFLLEAFADTTKQKKASSSWVVEASRVKLENIRLHFDDALSGTHLVGGLHTLLLKNAAVGLARQTIVLDEIALSKSSIIYNRKDSMPQKPSVVSTGQSNWTVSVKRIDLTDDFVSYRLGRTLSPKKVFDPNLLEYKRINLSAKNFFYSSEKTSVFIKKFSAVDQNGFAISEFSTDFGMDAHTISAKNTTLRTAHSTIDGDFALGFASLKTLTDSIALLRVNAKVRMLSIRNSDILYFNPQLIRQDFFKNQGNITTVTGIFSGQVNSLTGKNVFIHTAKNTLVQSDFNIVGLPAAETAFYSFPNLKVMTGKNDIVQLAGSAIPNTIELPKQMNLSVVFKGKMKTFASTLKLKSSFGAADLSATIDRHQNFEAKMAVDRFDLGSLLKDKVLFGTLSMTAETRGHGLDRQTMGANIRADVSEIYLNKYTYHNLLVNGDVANQTFNGQVILNDENVALQFDGLVDFTPGKKQYTFNLELPGANLQKLNLSKEDIRIGLIARVDMTGGSLNELNGKALFSRIVVTQNGKPYLLDSISLEAIQEPNHSEIIVRSPLVDLQYTGTVFPNKLPAALTNFVNRYFAFSKPTPTTPKNQLTDFNFNLQMHNPPILSGVLFPSLTEFVPGSIVGSFDSKTQVLTVNGTIPKLIYGTTEVSDLALDLHSDEKALYYKLFCTSLANAQAKLENLTLEGQLSDQKLLANLSSIDAHDHKKLVFRSQIVKQNSNYRLTLDPTDFYLMNDRWDLASDHFFEFGKQGFRIHHFVMTKGNSRVAVASVNDRFNDDLSVGVQQFSLDDLSRIVEKDTSIVKGILNGNLLLKRINNSYGIVADAKIDNLMVRNVPIGNLSLKASNPTTAKFLVDMKLSGDAGNNLTTRGYYIPNGGDQSIHLNADIQALSLRTVKAFSMGNITEASGNLTGHFTIDGSLKAPVVAGELLFDNAFITPAVLNNRLELKHETLQLKNDGIYFNNFTLRDINQHTATVDGKVQMDHFAKFNFALQVNSKDFLLFNTTEKDNKEFYGRMVLDSKIDVNGPLSLPVINARLKLKKGSSFTFAVPEEKLSAYKGENVVEFNNPVALNTLLSANKKVENKAFGLTGYDISSIIEIDKAATLKLLIDPASRDSLVVKGDAALSFTIDRSGKMSLTGAYHLTEGSYLVSLESILKRKFSIEPGSTILWNGDPMDAVIDIKATYSVRAAPIDLVVDQISGLTEADKGAYKQRYPFLVLLRVKGAISHPDISFEIQLLPEDKGVLNGVVQAKLDVLNEDPSSLNKQVFALLVLGRFVQENPLQSELDGGVSSVARSTVSKLLSAQLNQWGSNIIPGMELNFNVQSYDDYQSGTAKGRTQVDIGVKKQLFNERLSVQMGGMVDVEGDKAKQNSASNITSDVTIEYKITEDGRYRLKGFRHNQYEGVIEGQLVETGIGILYVRDFNKWKYFFRAPRKKTDVEKKKK